MAHPSLNLGRTTIIKDIEVLDFLFPRNPNLCMSRKTIAFIFIEVILITSSITCFYYGSKFFSKDHLSEIRGVVVGKKLVEYHPGHSDFYFLVKPNPGQGLDKAGLVPVDYKSYLNYDQWKGKRIYKRSEGGDCLHKKDFSSSYKAYGPGTYILLILGGIVLILLSISKILKRYDP